jgi:Zn finger protein HypA/HybF involved in hydrogenase expression
MSNFSDLINIDEIDKRDNFAEDRWEVSFYCKDCRKLVSAERPDAKWYVFICPECTWKRVVIWTEEWLKANYKIKS